MLHGLRKVFANPAKGELFDLGVIVTSPGALAALQQVGMTPSDLLRRHLRGDWGEINEEERERNEEEVRNGNGGDGIVSVYTLPRTNEVIVILTEANRSYTQLLTPEENY